MNLPFGHVDTTLERFLQELPADFRELAIEFKAFSRRRTIKTPEQVLGVVRGYGGSEQVRRETAGNFTLGSATTDPGLGRVGVGVDQPAARGVADRDRPGALPGALASGTGH